jgi:hypothetical protein
MTDETHDRPFVQVRATVDIPAAIRAGVHCVEIRPLILMPLDILDEGRREILASFEVSSSTGEVLVSKESADEIFREELGPWRVPPVTDASIDGVHDWLGAVRELVIPIKGGRATTQIVDDPDDNADAAGGGKTTTQIVDDAIATSRLRELLADANWRTDEEITWSDAVQYLRRHKLSMGDFERDMGEARETWRFAAILAWAGKQITRRDTQA